ncbi:hypothetical protein ACFVQ4_23715 [Streptomyces laurentii]|uniref:hypothetical protein n=1 Tax=Streptomyces laurentii TaxID=39478 RepID=UPI00367646DE
MSECAPGASGGSCAHRPHPRHTCASLPLAQGVDARIIMETLGYSTITMTLDTHAHVMPSALRAAAERMGDALGLDDIAPEE